jgi:hypothetical protein
MDQPGKPTDESAYDATLDDSFPASDPPSQSSPGSSVTSTDNPLHEPAHVGETETHGRGMT